MMKNDSFLKEMGAKIKSARLKNGMSLSKLSELSKIDMSNIWFIENGKRNVHILTLKSFADVFGMDVKDFL